MLIRELKTYLEDPNKFDLSLNSRWTRKSPDPIRFPFANRKFDPTLKIGHSSLLIQFEGLNILTDQHPKSFLKFCWIKRYMRPFQLRIFEIDISQHRSSGPVNSQKQSDH